MAINLIAQTGGFIGATGGTSGSIDTTGADFLVASVPYFSNAFIIDASYISDSKGNMWNQLGDYSSASEAPIRLFYVENPSLGSGHTFTVSTPGVNSFPSPDFYAFSGMATSSVFDVGKENGAHTSGGGPLSTGSITPSVNNALIFTGLACGNGTPGSVTPTMTSTTTEAFGATDYYQQGSASAINPSWSWTGGSQGGSVAVAAFKPAGGGGGGTFNAMLIAP